MPSAQRGHATCTLTPAERRPAYIHERRTRAGRRARGVRGGTSGGRGLGAPGPILRAGWGPRRAQSHLRAQPGGCTRLGHLPRLADHRLRAAGGLGPQLGSVPEPPSAAYPRVSATKHALGTRWSPASLFPAGGLGISVDQAAETSGQPPRLAGTGDGQSASGWRVVRRLAWSRCVRLQPPISCRNCLPAGSRPTPSAAAPAGWPLINGWEGLPPHALPRRGRAAHLSVARGRLPPSRAGRQPCPVAILPVWHSLYRTFQLGFFFSLFFSLISSSLIGPLWLSSMWTACFCHCWKMQTKLFRL